MTWISMAMPFPVTYKSQQQGMRYPLLGAVLHTTNHTAGSSILKRFQTDWQVAQAQSAHFAVDRNGGIGQFRSLTEVAWHINKWSVSYIGIEHIAHPGEALERSQVEASARILAWCADNLGVSLVALNAPGGRGVGIHHQFASTRCGRGPLSTGAGEHARQFIDILQVALSYKDDGLY